MIIAEATPTTNPDLFLVRFSNPDENFSSSYIPIYGQQEIYRRLYFKNRIYIIETFSKWFNQRKYAHPEAHVTSEQMLLLLDNLRAASFSALCKIIASKKVIIERIAPPPNSRFYNHYQNKIVPILKFCSEEQQDNSGSSS